MKEMEENIIRTDLDYLECAIIGTCTLDGNAYQRISHILTEKNFYLPFNKILWSTMGTLYPTVAIDSITVAHACKGKVAWFGGLVHHITLCESLVSSSANLTYHAMILLENRLKEAFEMLLKSFSKTDSLIKMEILAEITRDFKDCESIFDMIPIWQQYAAKMEWQDLAEAIATLNNNISIRIDKLKEVSQMDTLMNHLVHTYQVQHKHADTIRLLSSAIASLAIKGELPFGFKRELDNQITAHTL